MEKDGTDSDLVLKGFSSTEVAYVSHTFLSKLCFIERFMSKTKQKTFERINLMLNFGKASTHPFSIPD